MKNSRNSTETFPNYQSLQLSGSRRTKQTTGDYYVGERQIEGTTGMQQDGKPADEETQDNRQFQQSLATPNEVHTKTSDSHRQFDGASFDPRTGKRAGRMRHRRSVWIDDRFFCKIIPFLRKVVRHWSMGDANPITITTWYLSVNVTICNLR